MRLPFALSTVTTAALAVSVAMLVWQPAEAAVKLPSTNVAWQAAAVDADIDRVFARARAEKKPVLLY